MAQNIDDLQIEIESDATSACDGLDKLAASLDRLKRAVGGSDGFGEAKSRQEAHESHRKRR